jgi:hypothetical protein
VSSPGGVFNSGDAIDASERLVSPRLIERAGSNLIVQSLANLPASVLQGGWEQVFQDHEKTGHGGPTGQCPSDSACADDCDGLRIRSRHRYFSN